MTLYLYAITESYQWYNGADATHWGVHKTLEGAKKHLREIIEEKFDYMKDLLDIDTDTEEGKKEWDKWIDSRFYDNGMMWEDEDDDSITKYYIEQTELED